jgi:pimeloyl-ACP methyl ester carboxylesterase
MKMKSLVSWRMLPLIASCFGRLLCDASSDVPRPNVGMSAWRHHGIDTDFAPPIREGQISIANMTCDFFTQPLNHFVPRGRSPNYEQRYCVYTDFATNNDDTSSPILFYTGNESPLEQYINHTGLMWELAPKLKARVVFVEHRYEGQSLPNVSSECLSYASTIQALADYARILEEKLNPGNVAPVIAFGGSYGGMLSGWMRMKYPHLIAGAIAASAPIGAFPQPANTKIDSSARVLTAGINQSYPPDRDGIEEEPNRNFCASNLLAAWPLITWLVKQNQRALLQESFRLCEPVVDEQALLRWAQAIWFDLAEGSFPYPSSYVPFALIHKKVDLPAWPMQAACWNVSRLHEDWGVRFSGNTSAVKYRVEYGDSGIVLDVDWDDVDAAAVGIDFDNMQLRDSQDVRGLLSSVRDAVSIWYNITNDVTCYNISQVAPNSKDTVHKSQQSTQQRHLFRTNKRTDPAQLCHDEMKRVGSWGPLCCNDEMNLVITEAHGMGHDFFWPPSHPRGVETYQDIIRNVTAEPCPDPDDIFGYSKEPYELMSTRLDTYYGGISMNGHSNIIFSNGLLDPWSAGGVYKTDPFGPYDGPYVQNITEDDILAVIIKYGGHHTDLMYSNEADPACVTEARNLEEQYITKWINDWKRR